MNEATLFALIVLAALIHASFQLSVSMLTLVSGHALGGKTRHRRVLHLMSSFNLGAMVMTTLLLATLAQFAYIAFGTAIPPMAWAVVCGLMVGVAVAVWLFYYRRQSGTALWIPRPLANMLYSRIKATSNGAEAFSLGLTGVVAELIFTIASLLAAAFSIVQLPYQLQVVALITYVILANLPLLYVTMLVGSGQRISRIQRWRERNKRFLQVAAGSALFILSFYIYVNEVLTLPLLKGGF